MAEFKAQILACAGGGVSRKSIALAMGVSAAYVTMTLGSATPRPRRRREDQEKPPNPFFPSNPLLARQFLK